MMKPLKDAIRPTFAFAPQKLRDELGIDLTIVSETFQHTGSFKFRAAYNVAINVPNDTILTASSGNFGQAVAYSCRLTGKKAVIVMPTTSAQVKIDAIRNYGATVDLIDTSKIGRNERVAKLATEMPDAYLASPYDDDFVIDGNSTLGDELTPYDFDIVISPVGGGGLISGISKGLCRSGSRAQLLGAEPLLANDAARSLRAGRIIANEREPTATIADGARTISLGNRNWEIIKHGVSEIIEVSEEKIIAAIKYYFNLANLKSEPTGALSLGAVLERPELFREKKVGLVVSGGNVDPAVYRAVLEG